MVNSGTVSHRRQGFRGESRAWGPPLGSLTLESVYQTMADNGGDEDIARVPETVVVEDTRATQAAFHSLDSVLTSCSRQGPVRSLRSSCEVHASPQCVWLCTSGKLVKQFRAKRGSPELGSCSSCCPECSCSDLHAEVWLQSAKWWRSSSSPLTVGGRPSVAQSRQCSGCNVEDVARFTGT